MKEIYTSFGLGLEKTKMKSPLKWLTDQKVPLALHSDFTMAPAKPLFLMWTAVNKVFRQFWDTAICKSKVVTYVSNYLALKTTTEEKGN